MTRSDEAVVKLHDIARFIEREHKDPVGIKLAKDIRRTADDLNELIKIDKDDYLQK